MNLWFVFITGLTTGGVSCLAMQGGLLASLVANQKGREINNPNPHTKLASFDVMDWGPVVMFLGSKLVIHTLLGFFLGLLGSVLTLSLGVRLGFQVFSALFMLVVALNLLDVHPFFRRFLLEPPRSIGKVLKGVTKSQAMWAPGILGILTVFIPCGVTQAMMVVAMGTGNPMAGALTMFAFILGTSPLFALIGIAVAKLSEAFTQRFLKLAAIMLLFMSFYGLNGVLTVLDAPISYDRIVNAIRTIGAPPDWYFNGDNSLKNDAQLSDKGEVQRITIEISSGGYSPDFFTVKKGVPVEMTLKTQGSYSCASSFVFKKFNIFEQLGPTDTRVVSFVPTQEGEFRFTCSMGMYSGMMKVI